MGCVHSTTVPAPYHDAPKHIDEKKASSDVIKVKSVAKETNNTTQVNTKLHMNNEAKPKLNLSPTQGYDNVSSGEHRSLKGLDSPQMSLHHSQVMQAILPDARIGDLLKKVPLLRGLSETERDKLGGVMLEKSFKHDEKVFAQGEVGNRFYIIIDGQANVIQNDSLVASLHSGDYFGEAALLNDAPRGASIISSGHLDVLYLEKRMFDELFGENRLNVAFLERRVAVSAETRIRVSKTLNRGRSLYLNKSDLKAIDEVPDEKEKTPEIISFIMEALSRCVLTSELSSDLLEQIVESMNYVIVPAGTIVLEEGDLGENFYVVSDGTLSSFSVADLEKKADSGEKKHDTKEYKRGDFFGELALMYNTPRECTVTASTDTSLWLLDRFSFRRITKQVGQKDMEQRIKHLNDVELMQPLTSVERGRVAEALEEVLIQPHTTLFKQGDIGDAMYIVKSGHVVVSKRDMSIEEDQRKSIVVNQIGVSDYFGERALLRKEPRAATVRTGAKEAVLWKLDQTAFQLLLGPLSNLMEKKIVSYDVTNEVDLKLMSDANTMELIQFRNLIPLAVLGKGSYGVVQLVVDKSTEEIYGLKRVGKQQVVDTSQQEHIMSEKETMMTIKHPFLVRLFATYKSKEYLYFLLEPILGGELFAYLRKEQMFSPKTSRFYAASVILGFEYMHLKGMVYRDLKPENLLLGGDGYIKITDFGFAKKINDGSTWTLCGTPEYLAPEIVSGKGHGIAVDWWTLGILIFEMLASYTPFFSSKRMKMYQKIVRGAVEFPPHFSTSTRSLIQGLLVRKPSQRLGMIHGRADAIKSHQWFTGFDWKAMAHKKYKAPMIPQSKYKKGFIEVDQSVVPLEDPLNIEMYEIDSKDWDADF